MSYCGEVYGSAVTKKTPNVSLKNAFEQIKFLTQYQKNPNIRTTDGLPKYMYASFYVCV